MCPLPATAVLVYSTINVARRVRGSVYDVLFSFFVLNREVVRRGQNSPRRKQFNVKSRRRRRRRTRAVLPFPDGTDGSGKIERNALTCSCVTRERPAGPIAFRYSYRNRFLRGDVEHTKATFRKDAARVICNLNRVSDPPEERCAAVVLTICGEGWGKGE